MSVIKICVSPGGDDERGERSCVLGADEKDLDVSFLQLSGHLTPGAGCTESRI